MAKPNYAFEKRQRENDKKRKKVEKAQRKAAPGPGDAPNEPRSGAADRQPAPPVPAQEAG